MPNNKRSKKQKKNRTKRTVVPVGPPGTVTVKSGTAAAAFPVAMCTKLRYFDQQTLTAGGAGVVASMQYRTNSAFDPNYTGIGQVPAGFNALATLYNRYRVLSGKWKIHYVNDVGGTVTVSTVQTDFGSTFATIISAAQQGFSRTSVLSDQSGGRNQAQHSIVIQPWKVLGVTKERYMDDDQFSAVVTTNPAIPSYLNCVIQAMTVPASVQLIVDVVFDVVFFERALIA